ncbi:BON domain-containing protein [Streptomyces sp. NPDC002889]|uniref:BON domain-containing protein n=1 Tax=Streptomyces sp. NPDC002889 TaxID=3364669 RepID=UPI0036BC8BCD
MKHADTDDYRVAHLQERLAGEEIAELGVRVELRAGAVFLSGTVSTTACREEILRIATAELAGLAVREDLLIASSTAPDHPEELP